MTLRFLLEKYVSENWLRLDDTSLGIGFYRQEKKLYSHRIIARLRYDLGLVRTRENSRELLRGRRKIDFENGKMVGVVDKK